MCVRLSTNAIDSASRIVRAGIFVQIMKNYAYLDRPMKNIVNCRFEEGGDIPLEPYFHISVVVKIFEKIKVYRLPTFTLNNFRMTTEILFSLFFQEICKRFDCFKSFMVLKNTTIVIVTNFGYRGKVFINIVGIVNGKS